MDQVRQRTTRLKPLTTAELIADGDLGAVFADVIDFADSLRAGALHTFADVGHVRWQFLWGFGHRKSLSS
jgi:hypothetical protein